MIHQIAIPKEIYKDEAVQFIAGRYHTSTENVVACYIGQVEEEQDSLTKMKPALCWKIMKYGSFMT